MATSVAGIADLNLQKFTDALIASIRRAGGSAPAAAPDAFITPCGRTITCSASEFRIEIRIDPGGLTGSARVIPIPTNGENAIIGTIDPNLLATAMHAAFPT